MMNLKLAKGILWLTSIFYALGTLYTFLNRPLDWYYFLAVTIGLCIAAWWVPRPIYISTDAADTLCPLVILQLTIMTLVNALLILISICHDHPLLFLLFTILNFSVTAVEAYAIGTWLTFRERAGQHHSNKEAQAR